MARTRLVCLAVAVLAIARANVVAQTIASPDGWVVLPVDEYRALRERSNPPEPLPTPPPIDATLTRIDYDLRLDGETVSGRARLTIDVLRTGWARVQIPAGLMVRDASFDGRPVSLVKPPAGGEPHVLINGAGRAVLVLDVVIPVHASAGRESIVLPASPAPISRAILTLPKTGVDLTLGGGFLASHVESATESQWNVYGRPSQPLALAWKRKVDDRRAEQPLRIRGRVIELVGLGEDSGTVTAAVHIEVVQGLAREIAVTLPAAIVVNQVDGATVADWETGGGILSVSLLEAVASDVSFVVQGELRTPRDGTIAIPLVRIPAAERETGGVAVDVVGAGEIAQHQARGFDAGDPTELGDIVTGHDSPSMIAFRSRPLAGNEPRALTLNVVRYTPQAVLVANVEEARYRALASEDGHVLVEARFAVRNNQRSFLKVTMPDGAQVWSAEVAGRPIRPGVAERTAVLLPLEKGRAGEEAPAFVVRLVYFHRISAWGDKGGAHLDLPALDLPVSRTGLEIRYSPRFRVELVPGSFRADYDTGPVAAALRQPIAPALADTRKQSDASAAGLQQLVDRFRNESGGRSVAGTLPVHVNVPLFGPSIFLAAELTAESQAPVVELTYKKIRN